MLVGRDKERRILDAMLASPEAELVALYGRRRVGKTTLVREHLEPLADTFVHVTGEKDASAAVQLHGFKRELERVFYGGAPLPPLASWREGLRLLADLVERAVASRPDGRVVVFLDELPWLSTPRSGLLQALDHVWNTRLVRVPQLCVVLCGSAASWMLDKLVHAKGGLHNRITRRMRLEPFTLAETREYLVARGLRWEPQQVIELTLALGGVPYYLRHVRRGGSAAQNVAALCFGKDAPLADEFTRIFASLFGEAGAHEQLVRAIASRPRGILREDLLAKTARTSGGGLARQLRELEEAGFIAAFTPYGRKSKHTAYRLIDAYSRFYLTWVEKAPRGLLATTGPQHWQGQSTSPGYRSWSGHAFEALCLEHAPAIQRALGLQQVPAQVATWHAVAPAGQRPRMGAQIDLLFDRADGVITVCEMKYAAEEFVVSKDYARDLHARLDLFRERTGTKKQLSLVLVTPYGLRRNLWSEDLVEEVITAEALFAGRE